MWKDQKSVTCGAKSDRVSVTESSVLDCNEECEALKRLKELKEAFGIKEETNNFTSNELDALKNWSLLLQHLKNCSYRLQRQHYQYIQSKKDGVHKLKLFLIN